MNTFYQTIDKEVLQAIPNNWRTLPTDKLLGKDPCKVRFAFNCSTNNGKSTLINILALDSSLPIDKKIEKQLESLRDYIISKGSTLIVLHEQDRSNYENDLGIFISESFNIESKNFITIPCYKDLGYKTTINGQDYEDLNRVIHDIWNGELKFSGPSPGNQKVNLEVMQDECWKCKKAMKTVTGIVFPNKELNKWNNLAESYRYLLK